MAALNPSQIALLSSLTTQIRTKIVSSGSVSQSVQLAKTNVASSVSNAIISSNLLDIRPQPDITDVIKILISNVDSNQSKLVQNINTNLDNITKSQSDEFLPIKGQLLLDKIPYTNNVLTNDIGELLKNLSDKINALSVNTLEYEKSLASLISSTDRSGLVVEGLDGVGLTTGANTGPTVGLPGPTDCVTGGTVGCITGTGTGTGPTVGSPSNCTLGTPGCIAGLAPTDPRDTTALAPSGPTDPRDTTAPGPPGPTGCDCGCGGFKPTDGRDSAYLDGVIATVATGATGVAPPPPVCRSAPNGLTPPGCPPDPPLAAPRDAQVDNNWITGAGAGSTNTDAQGVPVTNTGGNVPQNCNESLSFTDPAV